nr:MAG TPA: hypothetical protein [Caudoviricetes sp.]
MEQDKQMQEILTLFRQLLEAARELRRNERRGDADGAG